MARIVYPILDLPIRVAQAIANTVLRDWKTLKAEEIRELHYAKLRANYVVEIIGSPDREPARQ